MALSRTNLLGQIAPGTTGTQGTGNFTSSSFTPPDSSLVVVGGFLVQNGSGSDPTSSFTISGGSLTWTEQVHATVSPTSFPTITKIWTAPVVTGASMTVTLSLGGLNVGAYGISVVAYTGYDTTTPVGATATGTQNGGFTGPPDPASITLSGAPATTSEVFGAVGCDRSTAGVTPGSTYTEIHDVTDTDWGGIESEIRTGSTSTTVDWVDLRAGGGSLFNYAAVAVEIRASAAAGSIPWNPQRSIWPQDYGESWWIQKDRRDANTVGSAANPLTSPLDTAWQADGSLWHRYATAVDQHAAARTWQPQQRRYISDPSMLATAELENELLGSYDDLARHRSLAATHVDRRFVPQQRPYVSDPLLLTTALLENELLGSVDDLARHRSPAAYVDRRLVPQQRNYVSDPLLLGTALLENELLGSFDDLARHRHAAEYVDRRLYPQQRLYISVPGLLDTAELENELLGGADDPKRYLTPATHAPRWWMPQQPKRDGYTLDQALLENELLGSVDDLARHRHAAVYTDRREVPQQRAYVSVPGLLDTAQLDELLGSADDLRRHAILSAYLDRRLVPQQRPYISDPSAYLVPNPPDITVTGWLPAWLAHNTPATHVDRREVPQQRLYVSDPSFYPSAAPTDPLTVAWGVGGTYWLLYNTTAEQVDRREVPQQRRYVSDPNLLATALLENELLGSADDLRRRYLTAAYGDRREVPQQRQYFDLSLLATALLENELLGGAGTAARYNTPATHADRREYPAQRLYQSDPLLLATALLEGPLLGALDSITRHATWWTDRRMPPQPARYDASNLVPPVPADPLLLAGAVGGDLWRRYTTAILVDRPVPLPWQPPRYAPVFSLAALRDLVLVLGLAEAKWQFDRPTASRWETAGPITPRWTIGGR